ncbi:hypothetical protein COS18_03315 [Candidatus Falkowbacteria bacterium CG02_land_8_20_14_3_00_36_14]|uniref:Uncharacterized protein n=1 Tax=Candidatus Falkowbacteria bacterium CG02_land_8_20_14_3_00_36_14 TaxID=1974560 RepID=A0A2M7DMU4_9BACT|nr:MAG: hypothetical protein COS18_03315 [Candidatus Falkowbacteria bacterium CG02_land_8_20_14_3_00_36_14]
MAEKNQKPKGSIGKKKDKKESQKVNTEIKEKNAVIPEMEKPISLLATRSIIEVVGKGGSYIIHIQILDKNNMSMKVELSLYEELGQGETTILPKQKVSTNKNGSKKIILRKFRNERRVIHIYVDGTEHHKVLILYGSKKPTFRKPIPGGFLKNFKRK